VNGVRQDYRGPVVSEPLPPSNPADPPRISRRQAVVVTAVVCLLVGMQLVGQIASGTSTRLLAIDVAVAVLGVAGLRLLVARPVLGGVLVGLLATVSPAATPVATLAAYAVARRRPFLAAAVVAATGVAAHWVLAAWRPLDGLPWGWHALLIAVAYAMLVGWGAYGRAREALLESLRQRLRHAEEEQVHRVAEAQAAERTRLAREMHDVLAHRLTLLATYAGALEYRPDSSPARLAEAAGVVRQGLHEALQEVREVLAVLRDPDEPRPAATRPPQPTLVDLPRLLEECRAAGMTIAADVAPGVAGEVPVRIGRDAYRVVQEGLTNARKHAPGALATVRVVRPGTRELAVEVANPVGSSDARAGAAGPPGYGLVGLAERVSLSGGTLRHRPAQGRFLLEAWFRW